MIEVWSVDPPRGSSPWLFLDEAHELQGAPSAAALSASLRSARPLADEWVPPTVYVSDLGGSPHDFWQHNLGGDVFALSERARIALDRELRPWSWGEFLPVICGDVSEPLWLLHLTRGPNVLDVNGSTYVSIAPGVDLLAVPAFHASRFEDQWIFPTATGRDGGGLKTCAFSDSASPDAGLIALVQRHGFEGLEFSRIWDEVAGGVLIDETFGDLLPPDDEA